MDLCPLRARRKRPSNSRTAEKRDELAPPHVRPQAQETALYRLSSALIGAEDGIKPIAAVHSQCRCWVKRRTTHFEHISSELPSKADVGSTLTYGVALDLAIAYLNVRYWM
jgi:hypothetical protein